MLDQAIDQTIWIVNIGVYAFAIHKAFVEYEIYSAKKEFRKVIFDSNHPRHIEMRAWLSGLNDEAFLSPTRLAEEALLLAYMSIGGRLTAESRARLGVRLNEDAIVGLYVNEEREKRRSKKLV